MWDKDVHLAIDLQSMDFFCPESNQSQLKPVYFLSVSEVSISVDNFTAEVFPFLKSPLLLLHHRWVSKDKSIVTKSCDSAM